MESEGKRASSTRMGPRESRDSAMNSQHTSFGKGAGVPVRKGVMKWPVVIKQVPNREINDVKEIE